MANSTPTCLLLPARHSTPSIFLLALVSFSGTCIALSRSKGDVRAPEQSLPAHPFTRIAVVFVAISSNKAYECPLAAIVLELGV